MSVDTLVQPSFAIEVESPWQRFWNRGGWWKAVLAAAVYLGLYLGAGKVTDLLFGSYIDRSDPLSSAAGVFFGVAFPILIGSVLLLVFAASLKWLPELFGRQPIKGRGWMWIAPVVVVTAAVMRFLGTDFDHFTLGTTLTVFATGLLIGFAEEVLTRGIAVDLLRRAGYGERSVMVLSSLVFALLHTSNLLGGQAAATVLTTVGFTFFFGIAMYLVMRVTGSIVWAILLHAITDPTTMLATGGIDATTVQVSPLVHLAGTSIYVYAVLGLVAICAVGGRVGQSRGAARRSAVA
ncbi:MAG: CPBP family intramembrane metalloprotease [Microbacterium sp.]|nr:CPBP family intramembrane metalloprotease [Microbacterium sp.]